MAFGFAKNVGDQIGFDALSEFGAKGVERNLLEAAENPAEIESYEDIDSLADFGTFVLEAVGENAAPMLAQVAAHVATRGLGGKLATTVAGDKLAKAAFGKAVKAKFPEEMFDKAVLSRAKSAAGVAGSAAVGTAFGTGETQIDFDQRGIDNPTGAFATGVVKGALDAFGIEKILNASKAVGVAPGSLIELAKTVGIAGRQAATAESLTEGLQTVVGLAAVKANDPDFEFFSEENFKDVINSSLKGGAAGGALGTSISGIREASAYRRYNENMKGVLDKELDKLFGGRPEALAAPATTPDSPPDAFSEAPRDTPIPEAKAVIDAQAAAVVDPTSSKSVLAITAGSPEPTPGILPDAVARDVATSDGLTDTLIAVDPAAAQRLSTPETVTEGNVGELLFDRPAGKSGEASDIVIVSRNAAGVPVSEMVSSEETFDQDFDNAERITPEGGTTTVANPASVTGERIARLAEDHDGAEAVDSIPRVTDFFTQLAPETQQSLAGSMRRFPSSAATIAAAIRDAAALPPEQQGEVIAQVAQRFEKAAELGAGVANAAAKLREQRTAEVAALERQEAATIAAGRAAQAEGKSVDPFRNQLREILTAKAAAAKAVEDTPEVDQAKIVDFFGRLPVASQRVITATIREHPAQAPAIAEQLARVSLLPKAEQQAVVQEIADQADALDREDLDATLMADESPADQDSFLADIEADLDADVREDEVTNGPYEDNPEATAEQAGMRIGQVDAAATVRQPPGMNANGRGFARRKAAEKRLAWIEENRPDPNVESREIVAETKDGRTSFFIQERIFPDQFAPEAIIPSDRSSVPASAATRGAASRSETSLTLDAIEKAKTTGKTRSRFLGRPNNERLQRMESANPGVTERLSRSLIRLKDSKGADVQMTAVDLTAAGVDLMRARGATVDPINNEIRLRGFETMLASLSEQGYDISDALEGQSDAGRIAAKAGLDPDEGPTQARLNIRKDILFHHDNLSSPAANAKDARVGDVRAEVEERAAAFSELSAVDRKLASNEREITALSKLPEPDLERLRALREENRVLHEQRTEAAKALKAKYPNDAAAQAGDGRAVSDAAPSLERKADESRQNRVLAAQNRVTELEGTLADIEAEGKAAKAAGRPTEHLRRKYTRAQKKLERSRAQLDAVEAQVDAQQATADSIRDSRQSTTVTDVETVREQKSPNTLPGDRRATAVNERAVEDQREMLEAQLRAAKRRAAVTPEMEATLAEVSIPPALVEEAGRFESLTPAQREKLTPAQRERGAEVRRQVAGYRRKQAQLPKAKRDEVRAARAKVARVNRAQQKLDAFVGTYGAAPMSPKEVSGASPDSVDAFTRENIQARRQVPDGTQARSPLIDEEGTTTSADVVLDPTGAVLSTDPDTDAAKVAKAKADARSDSERIASETRSSAQGNVRGYGDSITQEDIDFLGALYAELGLDPNVVVLDVEALDTEVGAAAVGRRTETTTTELRGGRQKVEKTLVDRAAEIKKRFDDDPSLEGTTIRTRDRVIIVVRKPKTTKGGKVSATNRALRTLVLAHEAGHNVFAAAVKNLSNGQRIRLNRLFEADKAATPVDAWMGDRGFEEWFADKVAARAKTLSTAPTGLADRIFHKVATQLKAMWETAKRSVPPRFRPNAPFDTIIDDMKATDVFSTAEILNVKQDEASDIHFPNIPIGRMISRQQVFKARAGVRAVLNRGIDTWVGRKLFTNDGVLRAIPGAKAIAEALYTRSNTTAPGEMSYQTGLAAARNQWVGAFQAIMAPYSKDPAAIGAALDELSKETPTAQLQSPLAKALRAFLDEYYTDYLKPNLPTLPKVENYFPRSWNKLAVLTDIPGFTQILVDSGMSRVAALDVANNLATAPTTFDDRQMADTVEGWRKERGIKDPEVIKKMVDAGFLNSDPYDGLVGYIHETTRRAEHDRVFGDWAMVDVKDKYGNPVRRRDGSVVRKRVWQSSAKLRKMLKNVAPNRRVDVMHHYTATVFPQHADPNSKLHSFLGELRAYESFRVLLGSGLASIPEVAGVFTRAKGEIGLAEFSRMLGDTITNFQDAKEFAEAMGVIRNVLGSSVATTLYMDPTIGKQGFFRRALPWLFVANGNELVTNYTRALGVQVAKTFLTQQANAIQNGQGNPAQKKRFLKELGIDDHNVILRWEAAGSRPFMPGMSAQERTDARQVQAAITTFVNQSAVLPNSSERPSWAAHPLGAFFIHLKTFAISFNKVILSGVGREMENRYDEGGAKEMLATLPWMLASFGMFMAFGAASDELRQRIFSLGTKGTLDAARHDPEAALARWFDRAGYTSLPFFNVATDRDVESLFYAAGPTAHHGYKLVDEVYQLMFTDYDPKSGASEVMKAIPGLSQLPGLRREIFQAFE